MKQPRYWILATITAISAVLPLVADADDTAINRQLLGSWKGPDGQTIVVKEDWVMTDSSFQPGPDAPPIAYWTESWEVRDGVLHTFFVDNDGQSVKDNFFKIMSLTKAKLVIQDMYHGRHTGTWVRLGPTSEARTLQPSDINDVSASDAKRKGQRHATLAQNQSLQAQLKFAEAELSRRAEEAEQRAPEPQTRSATAAQSSGVSSTPRSVPAPAGDAGLDQQESSVNAPTSSKVPSSALKSSVLPAAGTTASAIAKRTLPSVVMLILETNRGEVMGSGFVIAPNIVVTNNHVVKGARRGVVKFVGRDAPYQISRFTAFDPFNDLALVAITAPDVPSLTLRPDSSPELGDEIYVIGNPEGLEATFSRGNISGFRRRDGHDWLQITAPISHGSSGGPVLNASGEVIGVAVATLSNGQNLNFAVPAKYIRNLLTQSH